ncbi:PH domain-containing protein [Bifidobacterium saguinibicoloris]|uniref:PH domain-containing protein n=1 Tax=Bifidobacterium saguinibicoloris TaxID=2834433 RepID=UPI001C55DD8B|nr:PH domain-containing protein [Bifidobacterium saguinibicoloris]MBW3080268.1 PH domain-containing protein [Bifidobacterium saguinibicoloris]
MATPPYDAPAADPSIPAWRRLHPAALIVGLAKSVRGTVGWFVALLFLMRRHLSAPVIALLFVAAIAISLALPLVDWLTTRYRLEADRLSFRSGLLFRKQRTIAYGAIHAINSVSPFYLRPFHVISLSVSPVGADADIRLPAVSATLQDELERLRAQAHDRTDAAAASSSIPETTRTETTAAEASATGTLSAQAKPSSETAPSADAFPTASVIDSPTAPACAAPATRVFRASTADILLFAVTDIGFLAAALVVYGFVQQVQDLLPDGMVDAAEHAIGDAVMRGVASGAVAIALMVLTCVLALTAVSIATSLLRFHGFEVWRRGDDLMVVRGLFTRRTTTIPVGRIQTIVVRRSALRRPLRLCSVQLGLNAASNDGDVSFSANVLPVIGLRRVAPTLRAMLPEWDWPSDVAMRRTGRGLVRYYVTVPAVATLAATAVVGVGATATHAWPWWAAVIPLAAGLWWTSCRWLKARTEGYAILPDASAADGRVGNRHVMPHRIMTSGARGWGLFTLLTRRARVQSVTRSTTLWREPRGVESLRMSLFVMHGIDELRLRFLRRNDADTLERWFEGRNDETLPLRTEGERPHAARRVR